MQCKSQISRLKLILPSLKGKVKR